MNTCFICGKDAKSIYCSLVCGNIGRGKKNELEYLKSPKICEFCQEPIPYSGRFNNTYCSHVCAGRGIRHVSKEKLQRTCLECGNFVSGKKAKYCSLKCVHEKRCKGLIEKWKIGDISGITSHGNTSSAIKRYLRKVRGDKCEKCGWCEVNSATGKVPIQLEHIDGNWQNNAENNLLLLCPNCHSLTPTYGALNKGSGRKDRRISKS